jgi:hypothetical protein
MELNLGKTYMSNNPCFPRQLFHLTEVYPSIRFGKNNVLVTYERWAFLKDSEVPYFVCCETSWLFDSRNSILGAQLPSHIQQDFDELKQPEVA